MSLINFTCRSCGARCWPCDRDVVSRIRVAARLCSSCDRCAEEDVRVRFGAVVRRETARVVEGRYGPQVKPFAGAATPPGALGYVLAALVVAAVVAGFARPAAVDGLLVGAIAAGVLWFGQLLSKFLA